MDIEQYNKSFVTDAIEIKNMKKISDFVAVIIN